MIDSRFTRSPRPVDLAVSGERYGYEATGKVHKGWTPEDLDVMVTNWMTEGKPKMVIRLASHDSEVTAGYIVDLFTEQRGDQTYLCAVCEWNDTASDAIAEGKLIGISVEAVKDGVSRRKGKLNGWAVYAAALVSDPYYDLNDMRPVSLTNGQDSGILLLSNRLRSKETRKMNELLKRLGLAENATEADALKALDALEAKGQAVVESQAVELSTYKTKAADAEALTVKLSTVQAEVVKLQTERDTFKAEADKLKAEGEAVALSAFIDAGQREGKIATTDADKAMWTDLWKKDTGLATRMLAAAPSKSPVNSGVTGLGARDVAEDANKQIQSAALRLSNEKNISFDAALSMAAAEYNNKNKGQ